MTIAIAENVLFPDEPVSTSSSGAVPAVSNLSLPNFPDLESLLLPTKAQVYYWRELAGVLTSKGAQGVRDGEWPADLAPSSITLRALVERRIIVRRGRAWHLKRDWYARLTALRAVAVDVPQLTYTERPGPGLPSYAELEAFEAICRWLDVCERGRARLPFVGLVALAPNMISSDLPLVYLASMRKYRLVRHTNTCEWALSPNWRDRLQALAKGIQQTHRERFPSPTTCAAAPRSLAAGIDTWCLNRLVDDDALPPRLRHQLDELQRQAQEEDDEVETPWIFDDVPLRMYRAGVSAAQGGGVSWSYILRNPSLALRIRRVPLGGIIAHARLGSECLWRLTDRVALDRLDALVRGMWGRSSNGQARWQVSEVHLAHDVANAPIEREQLDRYVSRSRRDATYDASQQQMQQLLAEVYAEDPDMMDDFPVVEWDAHYEALLADAYGTDGEDDDDEAEESAGDLAEGDPIEERAVTAHRWGKRLSGVTWSPGGATSLVQYNKALECRLTGKNHMQTIWKAAGWQPEEGATRYEVRIRREALRELKLLGPDGQVQVCLDDPWEFLKHKKEVFAAVVGREEECPDAVNVAWIRLVVPQEDDTNSSRWPTDPLWRVVQDAPFADVPAEVRRLIRRKQRAQDVEKLNGIIYGCLASHVSLKHPNAGEWDISAALAEVAPALIRRSELPNKDFGTLARERRRERGLPVPARERLLPFFASREHEVQAHNGTLSDRDIHHASDAEPQRFVHMRLALAESHMAELLHALTVAEVAGASMRELERLEEAYLHELATYTAVQTQLQGMPLPEDR